ncbi:MAG TPA: type IV pilus biogenesis/stability protein PilW [Burkholderiales bacterium]
MKRRLWLAALVCLTACGGAPQKPADTAGQQSPKEATARERARIHTELGVSYYEAAKPAIALEELNEAIRIDRGYAPAWGARALVYMDLGEDAKAEADFKQSMRVDENDSDTKNNYGLFLCHRNRGKQGIRYFLEAIKNPLYETPDVAYKNAGLCSRNMGDMKGAEDFFQRALRANPNQPQALYSMADLSFARDDYAGGKQYLDRYMRAVPTPGPEALWLGARLERKLGDRTAMLSYGNQLRLRFPSAPETKAFMEGRFQ